MTNRRALAYTAVAAIVLSALWDIAEFIADRQTIRDTGWLLTALAIYAYLALTDD